MHVLGIVANALYLAVGGRMGRRHPPSALVSDVCAAALRAFCNAPQRER
jgi:hypothetical protein